MSKTEVTRSVSNPTASRAPTVDPSANSLPNLDRSSLQQINAPAPSQDSILHSLEERAQKNKSGLYRHFTDQDEKIERELESARFLMSINLDHKPRDPEVDRKLIEIDRKILQYEKSRAQFSAGTEIAAAVGAGVGLTVISGGAGAPAAVALISGAAGGAVAGVGAHRAVQGDSYTAEQMGRDALVGTATGLVGGAGIGRAATAGVGRKLSGMVLGGVIDGAAGGATGGVIGQSMEPETWAHGPGEAARNIGGAAASGAALGGVTGGLISPAAQIVGNKLSARTNGAHNSPPAPEAPPLPTKSPEINEVVLGQPRMGQPPIRPTMTRLSEDATDRILAAKPHEKVVIGRDDIKIDGPIRETISAKHMTLERTERGTWLVHDGLPAAGTGAAHARSANGVEVLCLKGTWVPVKETWEVPPGSTIRLSGRAVLTLPDLDGSTPTIIKPLPAALMFQNMDADGLPRTNFRPPASPEVVRPRVDPDATTQSPRIKPQAAQPVYHDLSERRPVIAVGDNHGCNPQKLREDLAAVGALTPDGKINPNYQGKLLQIGDTVDRGPHSQEIFDYWRNLQRENPDRVVRLMGNHELYHLAGAPNMIRAEPIPGLQQKLREDILAGRIKAAWTEGDVLYTHAGVDLNKFPEYVGKSNKFIADDLNRRLREATAKMSPDTPGQNLEILNSDPIFATGSARDGHRGGIFWARQEIENSQFRQVVGHTPQPDGIIAEPGRRVKYIDAGRYAGEDGPPEVQRKARELMINTAGRPKE